jgi:hypothetical protein
MFWEWEGLRMILTVQSEQLSLRCCKAKGLSLPFGHRRRLRVDIENRVSDPLLGNEKLQKLPVSCFT